MEQHRDYIYLTPMPVRIWHWINALGIVTLCVTGIQIRFPEYVNIFGTYKAAIRLHNTAGWTVAVSWVLWFIYYGFIARSLIKLYVPNLYDLKAGILKQVFYYFFLFFLGGKSPHHGTPDDKFNPMQKAAYLAIMLLLIPLVVVSGILLMNIGPLREWIMVIGGLKVIDGAHFIIACCFCAFLFVHVYLATMGHTPLAHFKPMWDGWEEVVGHGHGHESHEAEHGKAKGNLSPTAH